MAKLVVSSIVLALSIAWSGCKPHGKARLGDEPGTAQNQLNPMDFSKPDFTEDVPEEPEGLDLSAVADEPDEVDPEDAILDDASPALSLAADLLKWRAFRANGTGDGEPCFYRNKDPKNNMFPSWAGPELSFVFSAMGINMQPPAKELRQQQTCTIKAKVTLPKGTYIKGISQTLLGGVLKDEGATGSIVLRSMLFKEAIVLGKVRVNLAAPAVDEPLLEKTAKQSLTRRQKMAQCNATRTKSITSEFRFEVGLEGTRPSADSTFIAQLDTIDMKYAIKTFVGKCP